MAGERLALLADDTATAQHDAEEQSEGGRRRDHDHEPSHHARASNVVLQRFGILVKLDHGHDVLTARGPDGAVDLEQGDPEASVGLVLLVVEVVEARGHLSGPRQCEAIGDGKFLTN